MAVTRNIYFLNAIISPPLIKEAGRILFILLPGMRVRVTLAVTLIYYLLDIIGE
jgi:hypothetical protein